MTAMMKRWCRSRRNQFIVLVLIIFCIIYYVSLNDNIPQELDITRRDEPLVKSSTMHSSTTVKIPQLKLNDRYIESKLQEALKEDKGMGCEIPRLDPFAKEVTKFDKELTKVKCSGTDWVRCFLSECKVVPQILKTTRGITCIYRDILYESDHKYVLGSPKEVHGDNKYILTKSDHVKVKCTGKYINRTDNETLILPSKWIGHSVGFRSTIKPKKPPPGREDSLNILIFGFDSTSRNGFIRRMPKSYNFLVKELKATVLNGYNIVGDGTPAALFPILTGKNELELPDVRKKTKNDGTLDSMPFIFYKLKEDGYRTAYFEDMPWIGTFQYRFNGFKKQPADHYLRAFYLEESNNGKKWWSGKGDRYCVGDTPRYRLMMNITDQFLRLDGKRFCFTFIADITHDDFNKISTADEDFENFLRGFRDQSRMEDTLLIVMGDHGPRYANVRDTFQGKLEERLPLMALVLPERLKNSRPDAQTSLQINAETLTTPHDIYATILDVMGLIRYWNPYIISGADMTRGLTLLEPIPKNRSCSEAGIEPHWCACLNWQNVSQSDPLYEKAAHAFLDYINSLTSPVRSKCVPRTLTSISWVMRQAANGHMLSFVGAKDADGYVGSFGAKLAVPKQNYQIKVIVGPGKGVYEASLTYLTKEQKFIIDSRDISRTNAYNDEPACISATHPHLNMYCYCNG